MAKISLLLLWVFAPLWAETVNISAGVPHGGFGDIASNLYMARQLKRLRPELNIRVVVTDTSSVYSLKVLEPRINPEGTSVVDGIEFRVLDPGAPCPPADFAFGFSHDSVSANGRVRKSAPHRLFFYEYGMGGDTQSPNAIQIRGHSDEPHGKGSLRGATGVDANALGIYTVAQPTGVLTKNKLFKGLDDTPHRLVGTENPWDKNTLLAVSYTHDSRETERYLNILSGMAGVEPYKNKKIVVVTNHTKNIPKLPANVTVRSYSKIPFHLSEAAIAHSDLPVMVTGDVSLTLAIQHGRPFIYERMSWKEDAADAIEARLLEINPSLRKYAKPLNLLFAGTDRLAEPILTSLLLDKKFTSELSKTLKQLAAQESLPQVVLGMMDSWEKEKYEAKSEEEISSAALKMKGAQTPNKTRRARRTKPIAVSACSQDAHTIGVTEIAY